jgi:subtilase-type serine protease
MGKGRAVAVALAVTVAMAGCSSSKKAATGTTTTAFAPDTTPTSAADATTAPPDTTGDTTTVVATTTPVTTAPATTAPASSTTAATVTTTIAATTSTTSVSQSCAAQAALTYLLVQSATVTGSGGLTLTAYAAKMVCGGADDFHWTPASSTEPAAVAVGADIEVLPNPGLPSTFQKLTDAQFPAYLTGDLGTKIFQVTGPLSALTGLSERFHP